MRWRTAAGALAPALVLVGAVTLGAIGGLAIVTAAPATATSCAGGGSVATAIANQGVVFVGTVVSTTNRGRWATFAVEEVWSGDVSDTQVVKSGRPPDPDQGRFSGIAGEHTFEPGAQYLVDAITPPAEGLETVFADDDYPFQAGDLVDGPCSLTQPWNDLHASDRPPAARLIDRTDPIVVLGELPDPKPAHGRGDGELLGLSRPWQLGLGLVLVLALGAAGLAASWWRGRRRVDAPVA